MQRSLEAHKPRSIVADGLIVAGSTAVIYLLTFAFEYGYCAYFGIPGFLIEPSTGTVLFAALFISIACVFLVEASHLPRELLATIPWPRLRIRLVLVAFLWGTPALRGVPFTWLMVLNLSVWTLFILSDYFFALFFRTGTFVERISQGEKDTNTSKSSWDGVTKTFGLKAVGWVLIVYSAVMFAWTAGSVHARFQKGFIVLKSTPDIAVIKRYGDRFIAIRYTGTPAQATGEFQVINKDKDMVLVNLDELTIESVQRRTNSKAVK